MPLHRVAVCNHAFAFGYSLAAGTVYKIPVFFDRPESDSSDRKKDRLSAKIGSGRKVRKTAEIVSARFVILAFRSVLRYNPFGSCADALMRILFAAFLFDGQK